MSKLSQREQMAYATIARLEEERDTLRAELAGLRTGYDAQNGLIARLKAEKGLAEEARDLYAADKKNLVLALNDARAETEALRKGAGRYRWLRDKQTFIWLIQDWFPGAEFTDVDAEIDAAMAKEASHG